MVLKKRNRADTARKKLTNQLHSLLQEGIACAMFREQSDGMREVGRAPPQVQQNQLFDSLVLPVDHVLRVASPTPTSTPWQQSPSIHK